MSQRAKQFLRNRPSTFSISTNEGGYVGSLIRLGYARKEMKTTETGLIFTGKYQITPAGREWIGRPQEGEKRKK